MNWKTRKFCQRLFFISMCLTVPKVSGAQGINPFDVQNYQTNNYEISKLTCDGFRSVLTSKSPVIVPVTIWMHGVVAGLEGQVVPYSSDAASSMLLLGAGLCKDKHSEKIFDLLINLKSQEDINSKNQK